MKNEKPASPLGMPPVANRNITELQPYEKNAKIHKKEQIKAVLLKK